MEIVTDFIPKPGDRIKHRIPSGRIGTFVWAVCPDCSKGRWVSISNFNHPGFTGRCLRCNIISAKKGGWSSSGYYAGLKE